MFKNKLSQIRDNISKSFSSPRAFFGSIWRLIKFIFGWLWRILIPVLLLGLLIVPIFLTYFPNTQKTTQGTTAKPATISDLTKKISVQATTEYTYEYDLPVYQDSEIKEISVKVGDKVSAGQSLATLDFVNEISKIRTTTAENQIKSLNQEIANNNRAIGDARRVSGANMAQMSTTLASRYTEYNEILQRRLDKIKELQDKKNLYQKEKDEFDKQYADLENVRDVNDAIKQYQDKIDVLRRQRDATTPSNQPLSTQQQYNTQSQQVNSLSSQYTSQCPNGVAVAVIPTSAIPNSQPINCDSIYAQYKTANDNLALTYSQLSNAQNQNTSNVSDLNSQINDLQNKIDRLKKTNSYQSLALTDIKSNITDTARNSRLDTQKQELKTDSTARKNWIKQIDDNIEVKNYDEQILAKEKTIRELEAQQGLTKSQLDQTLSTTDQKNLSAKVSLDNAQKTLSDTAEDFAKQEKTKTITSKKSGIVGRIYKEQGLVVSTKESVFRIASGEYRLKFVVSADNRSLIKVGQSVRSDKYKELDNIIITDVNLVANPTSTTSTTPEYDVYAKLPIQDKYKLSAGETSNIDVIVNEQKNVLSVPTSSVFNGLVYVGIGETENQKSESGNNRGPISIGRNGVPRVNLGGSSQGGGNRGGQTGGSSSNPNSAGRDSKRTYKFTEIKEIKVETGLDDGRNIEIKSGLKEGDYVFGIFPKTDKDKQDLLNNNLNKQ